MLSFKQFLIDLFESRHNTNDPAEISRLVNLPHDQAVSKRKDHQNFEARIANAVRDHHSDNDEENERVLDHNSRHPLAWVRAHVAKNKHIHKFPHILQRLQNDPQKRVRETAEAAIAKQGKPSSVSTPAMETPKKEKAVKTQKPQKTPVTKPVKQEKPAGEAKKPGTFSIIQGDSSEHPYAKAVHHVLDHKGRKVGTVVHSSIPHEVGPDKETVSSYTGDQDRTGLELHQKGHKSVNHALLSLVNHLKGVK